LLWTNGHAVLHYDGVDNEPGGGDNDPPAVPDSSRRVEGDEAKVGRVEETADGAEPFVVLLMAVNDEVWEGEGEVGGVVFVFFPALTSEVRMGLSDEG